MPTKKGPQPVVKGSAGGLDSNQISPESTTGKVRPRLKTPKERIIVAGDVYCGKSYLYMRMAEKAFQEDKDKDTKRKFFYLDLDDTTPTFMGEDCEFEHLYCENGGNVYPFPSESWSDSAKAYRQIVDDGVEGDWLNIDTIGRLYEQSQAKTAMDLGINIDDAAYERGKANQGFGAFDGNQWNLVGRVLGAILNHAVYQSKINLMLTAHLRDVVEARAKRENLTMYQQIGFEPIGPPRMHGMMRTIVFLWANRVVSKEGNKVVSSRIARHLTVVKDRGGPMYMDTEYDQDGWETLKQVRRESSVAKRAAMNVGGTEAATLETVDMAERKIDGDGPEI